MVKKPLTKLNNKGMSLIELMVAIALLAIAGTVLFNGFTFASQIFVKTSKLQMAEDVAQYVAEDFRSHTLDELYNVVYGSAAIVKTDDTDPATNIRTITFTGIPCDYNVRQSAGNKNAIFTAFFGPRHGLHVLLMVFRKKYVLLSENSLIFLN